MSPFLIKENGIDGWISEQKNIIGHKEEVLIMVPKDHMPGKFIPAASALLSY